MSVHLAKIDERFHHIVPEGMRWQVSFKRNISVAGFQIDADVHDWLLTNTKGKIKVLTGHIWFADEEEAVLCMMRFSGGQ